MSQRPSWLQSVLQQSKLILVLQTLESRELLRTSARAPRNSSPDNRLDGSRIPSAIRDHYSCSVGQDPLQKRHNRYQALEPYDRTRVHVPTPASSLNSETRDMPSDTDKHRYLNANWVRELAGGKWWIAGQAPLPNTIHAFLTLCMSPVTPPSTVSATSSSSSLSSMQRVHTIVQLTPLLEGGRRRAHPYFPTSPQQSIVVNTELGCDVPPIHVFNDREEVISDAECIKTDLRLRWGGDETMGGDQGEYKVTHLLYTAWPDFGVPKDNRSIHRFAQLVERLNNRHLTHPTNDPNASPPILIHCSAGVGRTGSFIALSSLLRVYSLLSATQSSFQRPRIASPLPASPLGPLPRDLDGDLIAAEIDALREQRQSMVERPEQVIWVYKALYDSFTES